MSTQPPDLLQWATDATYPAGGNLWSGQPLITEPLLAEKAAGFVPNAQVPAEVLNWQLSMTMRHLDYLADLPALNWAEYGTTADDTFVVNALGGLTDGAMIAATLDSFKTPWLVTVRDSSGSGVQTIRSRDGVRWIASTSAPASIAGNTMYGIFGSKGLATARVIILGHDPSGGGTARAWVSFNGGDSWTGPNSIGTSGSSPFPVSVGVHSDSLALSFAGSAAGIWKSSDGATWTQVSSATSSNGYSAFAAAGFGESGIGVLGVRPDGSTAWSTDGTSWTVVGSVSANPLVAACWSESHSKWFILDDHGKLYSSPLINGSWTLVTTLGGGTVYKRPGPNSLAYSARSMLSFGRNLIILGLTVSITGTRAGCMLVYNPTTGQGHALSPGQRRFSSSGTTHTEIPYDCLTIHDGRVVAARKRLFASPSTYYIETVMSQRAPWGGP